MAGINTINNWETWKKEIDSFLDDEADLLPKSNQYSQIFKTGTTSQLIINDVTFSNYGPMVEVSETGDAILDEAGELYRTVYARRVFRKYVSFSSDLMETDLSRENVIDKVKSLVGVPEYSRDLYSFGMIRLGFDTNQLFADGKTLISIAHPQKFGGSAQANTFPDGVQRPLTYPNVVRLRNQMLSLVSGAGNILNVGGKGRKVVLWGSKYLEEDLFQIAEIETQPDTADRNGNFFKGKNFDVMTFDFVSFEAAVQAGETTTTKTSANNYYDSMWGLLDSALAQKYFKFYGAEGYPMYDEELIKKNQVLNKYAYDKYMFGASHWLAILASKGDNTTLAI
jgi:hypothetical protein